MGSPPAASGQSERVMTSDGSEGRDHSASGKSLDAHLAEIAAEYNVEIYELPALLRDEQDYAAYCANPKEQTRLRVWLNTQRPRLTRGDAIRALLLTLTSAQSMTDVSELLQVMDPESPAIRTTVRDVASEDAGQVLAWLRLGRSAAAATPPPPPGPAASRTPAPSGSSPLAISNASQEARQTLLRDLDSPELATSFFRKLFQIAARHGVDRTDNAAMVTIAFSAMSEQLHTAVYGAHDQDGALRDEGFSSALRQEMIRRVGPVDTELRAKVNLMSMSRQSGETLLAASQRATIAFKDFQAAGVPISSMDQITVLLRLLLPMERTAFFSLSAVGGLLDRHQPHSATSLDLTYGALAEQFHSFATTSVMAHSGAAPSKPSSSSPPQPPARAWQTVPGHGARTVKTLAAASPGLVMGASGTSVRPDDGVSSGSGAVAAVQRARGGGQGLVYCYTGNFDDDKRESDRRWAAGECLRCVKNLHFRDPERPVPWPCAIHKDWKKCPAPQAQPYPPEVLGGR